MKWNRHLFEKTQNPIDTFDSLNVRGSEVLKSSEIFVRNPVFGVFIWWKKNFSTSILDEFDVKSF